MKIIRKASTRKRRRRRTTTTLTSLISHFRHNHQEFLLRQEQQQTVLSYNGAKQILVQTTTLIKLYLTMEGSKGKERMVTTGESTDRNRLKGVRIPGVTTSVLSQVVQRRRKWRCLWMVRSQRLCIKEAITIRNLSPLEDHLLLLRRFTQVDLIIMVLLIHLLFSKKITLLLVRLETMSYRLSAEMKKIVGVNLKQRDGKIIITLFDQS